MRRAVVFVLPWFLVALGCARSKAADFWLLLAVSSDSGVRLAEAAVSPPEALVERRVDAAGVALLLRRDLGSVKVSAPGACPLVIDAFRAPNPLETRLSPLFDLGPAVRVVGPERRFEIHAVERCAEAKGATLEFRIEDGAPLGDVRIENGGRAFSATTRGVERVRERAAWGIVPVSARERGAAKIEVRGRGSDGPSFERTLEVAALSRASGLPSVALGHGVLLAGEGFRLEKRPEGSRAELRALGGLAELVPDAWGDYVLADAHGRALVVQSGRYDEMPLDCGRSDCHAAESAHARESPMTSAFDADLGGRHALKSPECAVACHTTGEPGTNDGGFSHVFDELGLAALPHDFSELPRALRRLGGVGCLACHGPARVPPDSARWAVLRSDVCATCHDAPPRYGHVAAFATTAMARADRDPRTRERPACARCHTTWGSRGEAARRPPAEVGMLGIGCVACHDVHGKRPLRPTSDVCIDCHSPSAAEGTLPEASAAAVWAGRGGSDARTGAPLEGPAPHANDARGCLRCHDSGPSDLERGKGHAFRANPLSCAPCHAEAPKRRPELADRARAIVDAILPLARKSSPPHAEPFAKTLAPAKARALRNALLVLEDPAADVHNPVYAERLLAAEERP
ncbi:MAG TPA: multiheme c-type cytochrome [Polyangiaceae bacterium]|nr:multiheme c-type cytochrome [Polyangiaceae bacterium]